MPFYVYKCQKCEYEYKTFHGINDQIHDCVNCNSEKTLFKVPQLLTSKIVNSEKVTAGERVNRYIEDARQLLKDSKQQSIREYKE